MRTIAILFLLCSLSFLGGYAQGLQFEKLTIKDGLSDNSVRDILQDSRGYLWLATLNGLDRYDGKGFKNYGSIPGDDTSFKNSRIQNIIEDAKGFIWCLTLDGRVSRVDPTTNQVLDIYPHFIDEPLSITDFNLMSSGALWLWGGNSCIQIQYSDDQSVPKTTIYNHQTYLPNSPIKFVHEDRHQNTWIGTEEGLVRLVQKEEGKEVFSNYFEGQSLSAFAEGKNRIWFGTLTGELRAFDLEQNTFQRLSAAVTDPLTGHPILCIEPITDQHLLLGSVASIYDVDIEVNTIAEYSHPTLQNVIQIRTDAQNHQWISAENRGVYQYNSSKQVLRYFDLGAAERSFLGDTDKQTFFEDSYGDFWVGIYGGGLFLYDRGSDRFIPHSYAENQQNTLSSNQVLCLFEDNSKNMWVGTLYGGVNKLTRTNPAFAWEQPIKHPKHTFDNEIRAVSTDSQGNLWMGSKGGKIFCYDSNFQKTRTLPDDLPPASQAQLNNVSVYCLYFDSADNLWIGTKGKGVFVIKHLLKTRTAALEVFHFDKDFAAANTSGLDEVFSIVEDAKGQFWIGSHSSGLSLLQHPFSTPQFSRYTKSNTDGKLVSNYIRYLTLDEDQNLWVGTSHGISILRVEQLGENEKEFLSITNDKGQLTSLSYNSVDYIFQAEDKTIYVATMGGGINQLATANWEEGEFLWKFYNKSMGLSTNKVYAFEEDEQHNLWISTSLGINKFNPDTETFENFYIEKDKGLNYFTESCATKVASGEIVFGHSKGVLRFNPREIVKDTAQYPIVLSQLLVNGVVIDPKHSSILDQSIEFQKSIQLDHTQNSIQLDFSVLDFSDPAKVQFSYKLENYDEAWSTQLTTRSALYQNLPPGNYTFWLKGTNSDGVPIQEPLRLGISIAPPFFKSSVGYALLALLIGLILAALLSLYKRQIKTKHQIEFTEKINEKKLKYYTNISHEFKTPLTMILSPAEDILKDEQATPEIITYATHIRRNAAYLLELVEQILDFRKIREEKMPLAVVHLNITAFIRNIFYVFKPLAEKSDIDFLLFLPKQDIHGYLDPKILEKILFNLLSNAFKHTPANKRIELLMDTTPLGRLKISVRDEGKGMGKKALSRLFERFYRSENSSGLGLFFVKELVLLHKGKIEVESEFNRGTTFNLDLPIYKSAYEDSEISNTRPASTPPAPSIIAGLPSTPPKVAAQDHTDRILIIDDNEEMRHYIANKLKAKYQVQQAANGEEGFRLAIQEIPDIIICDVMMPVLDGIATTEALRKNFNTSHIPIILLTANSSEEKRFEGIETGADDYITKPFDYTYLLLKIESLIQQRKQLRTHFQQAPELSADTLTRSDRDKMFIQQVTDIINKNLGAEAFSVELLAKKMNCSRTNFYKKMRGITGETPHEFIRTLQMKKAALLLKETNESVADIAYQVGYNDANYFSKSFKKHFGKTPKTYQKEERIKTQSLP